MAPPVPILDDVIEAVKTELDSVVGLGTAITSDSPLEDDVDFIITNNFLTAGTMNLFIITATSSPEFEGRASLEVYNRYQVVVFIWTIRTADAAWDRKARQKAEAARDEISGNTAIFRIGGQVPVADTPETCSLQDHGKSEVSGEEGPQMIYRSELRFEVEARRWT